MSGTILDPMEAAAIEVCRATDSEGKAIMLCDPLSKYKVRSELCRLMDILNSEHIALQSSKVAATTAHNIALLAEMLSWHLKPVHSNSCSNQNVLHPRGRYNDAAECSCQRWK